jgi:hypothetical protein
METTLPMATYALVMKAGKSLVTPDGTLPTSIQVDEVMTVIESYAVGNILVVTAAAGDPPDGWSWTSTSKLQGKLPAELAVAVGNAVLGEAA